MERSTTQAWERETWERGQTIDELTELLRLTERVAQRLTHESHFDACAEARALLDLLRRARQAADLIHLRHKSP